MSYFILPSSEWTDESEHSFETIQDVKATILENIGTDDDNDDVDLATFEYLLEKYGQERLVGLFNQIREYSKRLGELFPSGRIQRLSSARIVSFTREQILCLLCHMVLCTLKRTRHNMYWVTFENWLRDGRVCARAYSHSLVEYFIQSFGLLGDTEFMNQRIEFELRQCTRDDLLIVDYDLARVDVTSDEAIGDRVDINVQVDFANMDIGYGITGTQEEMLFASSPEMCIAMLFCDTMSENEAITIQGARRVAQFDGYGLDVHFRSTIPLDLKDWRERIVVCIDSLDLSEFSDEMASLKYQLDERQIKREVVKAYAGFSKVNGVKIDTGFWGCGAFGGHKDLKAIVQLVAASVSQNELNFNCFGDTEFSTRFRSFDRFLRSRNVKTYQLIQVVLKQLDAPPTLKLFERIEQELMK